MKKEKEPIVTVGDIWALGLTKDKQLVEKAARYWNVFCVSFVPENTVESEALSYEIQRNFDLEKKWNQIFVSGVAVKSRVAIQPSKFILGDEEQTKAFVKYNVLRKKVVETFQEFKNTKTIESVIKCVEWGDKADEVRNIIFSYNCGLIFQVIKKAPPSIYNEIVSNAMFVVLMCIDKFNLSMGFKFSTYATSSLHTNVFAKKGYLKHVHISVSEDHPHPSVYDNIEQREQIEHLMTIVNENRAGLSDMEKIVIDGRIFKDKTLDEISCEINRSKERVRQIQNAALDKIKSCYKTA